MAKRNRYRELESLMVKVLLGEALVFILYMIFAGNGWTAVKWIAAILMLVVSVGGIAWLYLTQEIYRRRSLWMVTGFGAIALCVLVSLILNYPCPPVTAG